MATHQEIDRYRRRVISQPVARCRRTVKLKRSVGLLAIVLVLLCQSVNATPNEDFLKELLTRAKRTDKVVLLGFVGDSCQFSTKMEAVLEQPELKSFISQELVYGRFDLLADPNFGERYGFRGTPSFVFLTSDGRVLRRTEGFRDKEIFLKICEGIKNSHLITADSLLPDDWELQDAAEAAQELSELGRPYEAFGVLSAAFEKGRSSKELPSPELEKICWLLGEVSHQNAPLKSAAQRLADSWSEELATTSSSTMHAVALARFRSSLDSTESMQGDISNLRTREMKTAYVAILQLELLELGLGDIVQEFGTVVSDYESASSKLSKDSSISEKLGWCMVAARQYQLHLVKGEPDQSLQIEDRALNLAPSHASWIRKVFVARACDVHRAGNHHLKLLEEIAPDDKERDWSWKLLKARVHHQLGRRDTARSQLTSLLEEVDIIWHRSEIESALRSLD